ncbi:MAG: adenosylmethionine decarboxylase [Elainellaceae cyanobacterium]
MLHVPSGQLGDRNLAPVGIHCILELYGCPSHLLNDGPFIQQALRDAARQARSTLVAEVLHQFEPQGVTALALLAESHISIHTWPEAGYAAVDVFTCGEQADPERACHYLTGSLQAAQHDLCKLPRKTGDREPEVPTNWRVGKVHQHSLKASPTDDHLRG